MADLEARRSLLVLGLGNPILRDDSAGLVACARARRQLAPIADKAGLTFKELCIGGFDLLYEIEGFDHLIVIDAFHTADSVPGRVRTLSLEDLGAGDAASTSGHLLSLPKAMELSRSLGYRTPKLLAAVVIDVGTSGLEFGEQLSPEVAEAVPLATDMVCSMVKEIISIAPFAPDGQEAQEIGL